MTATVEPTTAAHRAAYEARAEALAQRVTEQWQYKSEDGLRGLSDAVYQALVDEANLELRQVLTHLRGQLELASLRAQRGQTPMTSERITSLMDALDRGNELIDIFLDRSAATKLTIQLDRQQFDLADALTEQISLHGMADRVRITSLPAPVFADHDKLLNAIVHLVTRFYFSARHSEQTVVAIGAQAGRVEGFIGLSPSHLQPEELMDELRVPLTIEDVGIDVAYVRAVVERHNGTFFVATAEDASVGFGFTLPMGGRTDA